MSENGALTEVITEYLQAVDAGEKPDRNEVLARHPELATELGRFFATQDRLTEVVGPLRTQSPIASQQVGDYEILGELGRGGMGVVYRARQVSLGRVVALKMLVGGGGTEQSERLQQESRLLAELEHPHIVPVYDMGQRQGQAYFAMKLIEGHNLEEVLPSLRNEIPKAVRILAVVARAVHFAHQKGVLHRDLKPANVLLDTQGTPYVTDFGLARRLDHAVGLTQTGALVGTPAYMAPEQATGRKQLTPAVDVWALGVMLYRLLTGELPYRGETPLETLHLIVGGRLRIPAKLSPGGDPALQTICLHCLRSDPRDRYQTAAELAQDLEQWLEGGCVSVERENRLWSRAGRIMRRSLRSRWLRIGPPLFAVIPAVLAVIGYVAWTPYQVVSHQAMMDRVEATLGRGQVDLAREQFEARRKWTLTGVDDPVRERRERAGRLLQSHLFSLHENSTAENLYWQFNGHLLEIQPAGYRERDGRSGTIRRSFASSEEWEQALPGRPIGVPQWQGRLTDWVQEKINNTGPETLSPNGLYILTRIIPRYKKGHDIFARVLRDEGVEKFLPDDATLLKSLPSLYFWCSRARGLIIGVNWFQNQNTRRVFQVYLLGERANKFSMDFNTFRVFLLPAGMARVSWSEDSRRISFCDALQPISPRRGDSALRFTYDLHERCWIRIVDSRPGVWIPPTTADQTMISFPPDRNRCKDLGELEAITYFRSGKNADLFKVGLSPDGTRVWLQCPGQNGAALPSVHVWRMPGVPR